MHRPPFRADHIGSLLRPPALREAFKHLPANSTKEAQFRQSRTTPSATW